MNGDKTLANIAYANRGEQEERFASLELEKQELEAKNSRLEESLKKQISNAFDGWGKVIESEKENEHLKQAWEIAKTEALGWGAEEYILDDDEEMDYQACVQDMFEDFVAYYEKALEGETK